MSFSSSSTVISPKREQSSSSSSSSSRKRRGKQPPIRYRTVLRNTIVNVFESRGWKETDSDEWDIFWTDPIWMRDVFDHIHLESHQRVNHFRNHYELTRKDLMVKNLKRAKRLCEKEGNNEDSRALNFFPTSFNLPVEYSLFVEAFKKHPLTSWIMKPIGRSQGKGIFLFQKLHQISEWRNHYRWKPDNPTAESYIVQEYISNPLLIGGKKFDLRIYTLVTSYTPLTIYLYRSGFARFSSSRFSMSNADLSDNHIHLTNIAVQKTAPAFNAANGGKWSLRSLKLYLMSKLGQIRTNEIFHEIQLIIIRSLRSVQKIMINDKHCFELYGYDILIDSKLKPWLIEVNAYPSLSANTKIDYDLKTNLLHDVLNVIDLEHKFKGNEKQIGGFDLIYRSKPVAFDKNCILTTYLGCENNRVKQLRKLHKHLAKKKNTTNDSIALIPGKN